MINTIIHLSDLHIRNGDDCRYDEYYDVFNNTIQSIKNKNLKYDEFIIVITGDIFHNKNVIGNYGLSLYKFLIQSLTKLGRVIIFHGNHDKNQNNINQPSLVLSCTFDIKNLTILNETQSLVIDDIGFSYVSIDDTLDVYKTSGRIQDLPEFPKLIDVKHKVALFHGTFTHSKLFNGEDIKDSNPYPLEWIKDFDYVLLGDIHKRQYSIYNKKTYYGYSGSLIQQNYGEDIIEHGYLIWKLNEKTVEEVNIYNNVGLINIKEVDDTIMIRNGGKYINLEEFIKNNKECFPKKIEIKLFSNINFEKLNDILTYNDITFNIISNKLLCNDNQFINTEIYDSKELVNIVDNEYLLEYFKKYLDDSNYNIFTSILKNKEFLLLDASKYPSDLKDECLKRNKELQSAIVSCIKSEDIKQYKSNFVIKYLEWDGLYCYENKNWIDFSDLISKTFMIKGKNGTGKSAIYDILTLAIWGEITTLKQNSLTAGLINHKKSSAHTIIDIEVDNVIYRIERSFVRKEGSNAVNKAHKTMYKFINNKDLELYKKENACNEEITKLFGTIDNFLTSSMITQNMDYDILKMGYKECVDLIDKSCNIDYINNLYNLFKVALNKYKDFKRIVDSKKQVYEKLLSNNKIDDDLDNKKNTLKELINKRDELIIEFNKINVDISNPDILTILDTDYDLKGLNNTIASHDEYIKLKEKYDYIKHILKDEKDLVKLYKLYNESIKIDEDNVPEKPCNISYINEEEKELLPYLNKKYEDCDIDKTNELLKEYNKKYSNIDKKLKEHISVKPLKVDKPKSNKDLNNLYNSYDELEAFIKCNNEYNRSNNIVKNTITYGEYKTLYDDNKKIKEKLEINRTSLNSLEKDLTQVFTKQKKIIVPNKPNDSIKFKTSVTINKHIKTIDINKLEDSIKTDESILDKLNKINDSKTILENELETFKNELEVLNTTEEYKYNPECIHCCSRSWVKRIKELDIIISKYEQDIKELNKKLDDAKYDIIAKQYEENIKNKDEYYGLLEWYEYYKNKELYTKINGELNTIMSNKDLLNKDVIELEKTYNKNVNILTSFYYVSLETYDNYNNMKSYDIYNRWNIEYNKLQEDYTDVKNKIEEITMLINYNKDIKPRLDKLIKLKEQYKNWEDYEFKYKIIKTNELFKLKEQIDVYDEYVRLEDLYKLKPLIKNKIDINDSICGYNNKIKELNEYVVKNETIIKINSDNLDCYNTLLETVVSIDTVVEVVDIILSNFQTFRIDLYDKYIINKLKERSNAIIKLLCHTDTKPFELDYIINIHKDSIHINWLIKNVSGELNKIISVHQASGYQRFVISLALRMSLFVNKNETLCNQLFIDEGFVSFDKENLSIVPSFLKNLLLYFHNIVIVSHIELIQDNVDELVLIEYNKNTNISSIKYLNEKNTVKKRNKV